MNKRIKQLAGQAGLTFVNSITDDNEDIKCVADTDGGLPCSTELEKFAELIVKECIDICKERHWTWRWDETTSGPNECAELIKKHFGVEE